MIIVSQDKTLIVNFENIIDIWIEEGNTIFFTPVVNIQGIDILGKYETEKRAQEVLQEIINKIGYWEDLKAGQPHGTPSFKYEMPKEWEYERNEI